MTLASLQKKVFAPFKRAPKADRERSCSVDSHKWCDGLEAIYESGYTATTASVSGLGGGGSQSDISGYSSTGLRSRNSSSPCNSSPGRTSARGKVRAVDENTVVPEGIYMSLLQAAKAIEDGGQHKLVCEQIFLEMGASSSGSTDIENFVSNFARDVSADSQASTISIGSRQRLVLNGVSKRRVGGGDSAASRQKAPPSLNTTTPPADQVGESRPAPRRVMMSL
eukprot:CAMPEP_0178420900 /NCGR_PEP_ID=MMETSP0689_2-20121128/26372_1 /TAXON_ID=160604 /ORGANISM="Amphidinium massartii, Strain CS-259" /LENGTH=223 /DNA_ID=CAMNT_0020042399 /DNA_START=55 /DNA_END=726 /DNA_ORIENTATION=-